MAFLLSSCASFTHNTCPITEPEWLLPPEDSAVSGEPTYGYCFANPDRSILASAWWTEHEEYQPRASGDGIKVGWFRPTGATLEISGRRIDAEAPHLEAHVPCCYPTQFQSSGLFFPSEGCWEISATAANSAITFVIEVLP